LPQGKVKCKMRLEEFREKSIVRNDVVEYTIINPETNDSQTRIAYFDGFQEEEIPEEYKKDHKQPPYITLAHAKERNGCFRDFEELSLEKIRYIYKIGKSRIIS